ncbi:hypothetical protein ACJIZ3_013766 [Penstemon smallii]|uniref:Cellulose synthase-like protein G2 n=1 Tax=Penstemon smallii TaxID=265156 RepID=A0ABD3RI08_9LAMI
MEDNSLPLNDFHVKKTNLLLNRLHMFLHGIALLSLFYYRITTLIHNDNIPLLPYILVFITELILSFIWLLSQASNWKPITRKVYIERLPENEKLPSIDVFICTADPNKEPSLGVMNTIISALALDYPSDNNKLNVYLSDDGGSFVTLLAVKEAWKFAKFWISFCRKYEVMNRCPEAYFLNEEIGDVRKFDRSHEFVLDKKEIEKKYDEFKDCLVKIVAGTSTIVSKDHPPLIEVISDSKDQAMDSDKEEMPLLVYVAREKRPSHHHNFKAGALNVLLRVSGLISNSPYILVLDCDMYCNDPTSARQAMCFHLDSKLSPKLAFVQFPQTFANISETDIYDGQWRYLWQKWHGLDGIGGPILSGTGFYIKRKALYGIQNVQEDVDLIQLQKSFGSSNEFIKSVYTINKPNIRNFSDDSTLQKEIQFLASCSYDKDTNWGEKVGFRYFTIVEDYFTGFNLHREGWISVYIEPSRPCFLGASPISLGEFLIQNTKWLVGLMQVGLSRFSPLLYGSLRMSTLQIMGYAEFAYVPLCFSYIYCLAIVPQLCLLRGIALYPPVSSPFFLVFSFLFLSSQLKHVQEVLSTGHSIQTWANEQRFWMMKSATCFLFATLEATMEKFGLTKVSFLPTNKVVDVEQAKLYQMGIYDFQAPPLFMVPLCSLYILNVASFFIGLVKILQDQKGNEMFVQAFIPFFGMVLFFPLFEGMVLRTDKGRVSPFVSIVSCVISIIILFLALVFSY